jgi:hypothetical protein
MKTSSLKRSGKVLFVLLMPLLMGQHGGCGDNIESGLTEIPKSIRGCSITFTAKGGKDFACCYTRPLVYKFMDDGRVEGSGTGGTYYSVGYSYNYSSGVGDIHVDWPRATEDIKLENHTDFVYVGYDIPNNRTFTYYGTYSIAPCPAATSG